MPQIDVAGFSSEVSFPTLPP